MADNSRRVYVKNGVEYPRVGTIIPAPDLMEWAAEEAIKAYIHAEEEDYADPVGYAKTNWRKKSRDAMDEGTKIHDEIDRFLSSGKEDPNCSLAFYQWKHWSDENVKKYLAHEVTVVSEEHGFGGTIDAIAEMHNGNIYVLDWKTGKAFYDSYPLQIGGAYSLLAAEAGFNASGAMCVKLPKERYGIVETKDYSDNIGKFSMAFLGLLEAYYHHKKRKLKNNPIVKRIWG